MNTANIQEHDEMVANIQFDHIPLDRVQASPHPIRESWDNDALEQLAQSIKEQGVIQPVKVRFVDNHYELVDGHRRTEAARRAGLEVIPAMIEGLSDTEAQVHALIAGLYREDFSDLDTARAIKKLKDDEGWTYAEFERRGILTKANASYLAKLLNEPDEVQELLDNKKVKNLDDVSGYKLSTDHIVKTRDGLGSDATPNLKVEVLKKAKREGLTGNQTKAVAQSVAAAPTPQAKQYYIDAPFSSLTHDPEFVRERAQRYGAKDPIYKNDKPSPQKKWDDSPKAKNIVKSLQRWNDWLKKDFKAALDEGTLDDIAARQFITSKMQALIKQMEKRIQEMETYGKAE